jgi:hypothetical protein
VYVSYASPNIDTSFVPENTPLVVVHNDASLPESSLPAHTVHIRPENNVGFGAGVNLALARVTTRRSVVCNPDALLTPNHWQSLSRGQDDVVTVIPLVDGSGRLTSVVNKYPTPSTLLLSGYRAGRLVPRGGMRRLLAPALGAWGRAHRESLGATARQTPWPLNEYWFSGAVFSAATSRLRSVGGFDERYFLYYEDIDLSRRLAERFPSMSIVMPDVAPGSHVVGGATVSLQARRQVERVRLASAIAYARQRRGPGWAACRVALAARARMMRGGTGS